MGKLLRKKLPWNVLYIGPERIYFGVAAIEELGLLAYKTCDIELHRDNSGFKITFRPDPDGMRAVSFLRRQGKLRSVFISLGPVIKKKKWPQGHFYFGRVAPNVIRVNFKDRARNLAPLEEEVSL